MSQDLASVIAILPSDDAVIEISRWQREAIDKHTRWHLALLDAGIPGDEANDIIAASTGFCSARLETI